MLKQLYNRVELEVRKWCHPEPTKRREILDFYPHLFPATRDFQLLFFNYVSPVDALMKGHSCYHKVARKKQIKAVKVLERIDRSRHRAERLRAAEDGNLNGTDPEIVDLFNDEAEAFDFLNPPDTTMHSFLT
eukprot:915956-Rhodomonas_salina.2